MKKVWLIEDGIYSDYSVYGVFSTRENAVMVASYLGKDEDCVKEWVLDPNVEQIFNGHHNYEVIMLRDGSVESCYECYRDLSEEPRHFIWHRTESPAYKGKGVPDALNVRCFAKNSNHAIKIAGEIRTRVIASGEWK